VTVLKFEIRYPNGQRETAVVEGERALIGSASYADVRLPVDQAAYEHVVIEVMAGTVRAVARAYEPPATVNGMPLTASHIEPNTVLGIGTVQIFVAQLAEGMHQTGVAPKTKTKDGNPIIRVVGLVAIVGLGYMAFAEDPDGTPIAPANAPALFSSAAAACKQSVPEQAVALARETIDLAEGKRERHPFAPSEGVAAVDLYRQAAACFRVAKDEPSAAEADSTAQQLKASITTDFRARRLRLEHMLAVQDFELAARDVSALKQLTQGKPGPYTTWLASLDQDLKRRRASAPPQ